MIERQDAKCLVIGCFEIDEVEGERCGAVEEIVYFSTSAIGGDVSINLGVNISLGHKLNIVNYNTTLRELMLALPFHPKATKFARFNGMIKIEWNNLEVTMGQFQTFPLYAILSNCDRGAFEDHLFFEEEAEIRPRIFMQSI